MAILFNYFKVWVKFFALKQIKESGIKLFSILTSNGSHTAELLVTEMTEKEKRIFITFLNRAYENVKNDSKEATKEWGRRLSYKEHYLDSILAASLLHHFSPMLITPFIIIIYLLASQTINFTCFATFSLFQYLKF